MPVEVPALLTVCVRFVDKLVLKFPSPLYAALMVWLPTTSELVLNAAGPEPFTATGVRSVPSTVKVIVPVRVPAPGATALTVAVNVTDWPVTDGLPDEATAVVVLALLTVWPPESEPELGLSVALPL